MKKNSIPELIEEIRQGRMIILVDDEDRENEGDLVMAASEVTAQDINFMAAKARGLICLTLTEGTCKRLELPLMVAGSQQGQGTNFTCSIEAASGVTTGISAADRAHTIRTAVHPDTTPDQIVQPGHVFPLMAKPGGVLYRAGHTEAGCDLTRLAGLQSAAVIVEIMNEDGTMARRQDLEQFAERFDLKIGTIADLIQYRSLNEKTIERVRVQALETEYGTLTAYFFRDLVDQSTHIALVKTHLDLDQNQQPQFDNSAPLVRVHVADPFRDLLGVKIELHSSWSVAKALKHIADAGEGVLVLLSSSFEAQDLLSGADMLFSERQVKARQAKAKTDEEGGKNEPSSGGYRTIGTGSQILKDLGIENMRLMSRVQKFNALSGFGLKIVEYIDAED